MKKFLFFLWIFLLSGCATLITGSDQTLQIRSKPEGAEVKQNGLPQGKTPCSVVVRPKEDFKITIEKEGFQSAALDLKRKKNKWFWANFAFPPGFLVDLITGAYKKIAQEEFYVELKTDKPEPVKIEPPKVTKPEKMPEIYIPK